MKRTVICFVLILLAMCGLAMTAGAEPAHQHCLCASPDGLGCDHSAVAWQAWESVDSLPTESGSYYLTKSVVVTKTQRFSGGTDVRLCLNGYSVSAADTVESSIYAINAGAHLTLTDCQQTGTITGAKDSGIRVVDDDYLGTKMDIYGGIITGNTAKNGGGICLRFAELNLYGGTITKNTADETGGGIYAYGMGCVLNQYGAKILENKAGTNGGGIEFRRHTKLYISGGEIRNNYASIQGGGICSDKGYLFMSGGAIEENRAAQKGGGVFLDGVDIPLVRLAFSITGGSIANNASNGDGGGLYLTRGKMEVSGITLKNNTAKNGGGFCTGTVAYAFMDGVTFENNEASKNGGGLCLLRGSRTTMTDCTVTGNTAGAQGGGIWADDDLDLTDPTVIGNSAGTQGGGVYLETPYYDGHSYISNLVKLAGTVNICDNGDTQLYIAQGALVHLDANGLAAGSQLGVTLASGQLTKTVYGAYDFESKDGSFLLTQGNGSLAKQKDQPQADPGPDPIAWVVAGIVVAMAVAAAGAFVLLRKEKGKEAEK